jgi:hypothetical protein
MADAVCAITLLVAPPVALAASVVMVAVAVDADAPAGPLDAVLVTTLMPVLATEVPTVVTPADWLTVVAVVAGVVERLDGSDVLADESVDVPGVVVVVGEVVGSVAASSVPVVDGSGELSGSVGPCVAVVGSVVVDASLVAPGGVLASVGVGSVVWADGGVVVPASSVTAIAGTASATRTVMTSATIHGTDFTQRIACVPFRGARPLRERDGCSACRAPVGLP